MDTKIVVSIDPHNIKQNVIDYGVELARAGKQELLIYSVQGMPMLAVDDGSMPHFGVDIVPGTMDEVERIAEELFEQVKERYPNTRLEQGMGFQATATIGKMEEEIRKCGERSCLLVMPKTSDHSWWNNVLGTAETAVAAEAPCPVLFVPPTATFHGISNILYLADTTSLADGRYKGFRFLQAFAARHTAQVVVGFVVDIEKHEKEAKKIGEAMDRFKDSLPFQFTQEYQFFLHHTPEEILEIANLSHTDIIAFPFRETHLIDRFFEHEITRTLVLKANLPVLVF